jgi:hypothetical protein
MIYFGFDAFGRKGRLELGWFWLDPFGACFAGALVVEGGPARLTVHTRRQRWEAR